MSPPSSRAPRVEVVGRADHGGAVAHLGVPADRPVEPNREAVERRVAAVDLDRRRPGRRAFRPVARRGASSLSRRSGSSAGSGPDGWVSRYVPAARLTTPPRSTAAWRSSPGFTSERTAAGVGPRRVGSQVPPGNWTTRLCPDFETSRRTRFAPVSSRYGGKNRSSEPGGRSLADRQRAVLFPTLGRFQTLVAGGSMDPGAVDRIGEDRAGQRGQRAQARERDVDNVARAVGVLAVLTEPLGLGVRQVDLGHRRRSVRGAWDQSAPPLRSSRPWCRWRTGSGS